MSPVHVIVGEDTRAEHMWASAFTGAVDLYRFDRNVDAFERLMAAEAPIDLVVLTPAQRGPFNLTPDQFIARVLESPLGASRNLANLHVIVVGQQIQRSHPRVMAVSTLDAAIRLVKFGEIERAPKPAAPAPIAPTAAPRSGDDAMANILGDLPFAGSVISRIWDAPDPVEETRNDSAPRMIEEPEARRDVQGGGPAVVAQPVQPARVVAPSQTAQPQLFTRASAGFVMPADQRAARAPEQAAVHGGGAMPIGAPGEAIEVASGVLQPARQYQLPNGGGYRGPSMRGSTVHGAAHDMGGQPVPPALASQVQSMVYGPSIGNPNDPLLVWSSALREQSAPAPGAQPAPMPALNAMPAPQPHAMPVAFASAVAPIAAPVRVVPMEPPTGAYGAPVHTPSTDPFLRRAEQGGAGVAFG